jgi:hypothetical protein
MFSSSVRPLLAPRAFVRVSVAALALLAGLAASTASASAKPGVFAGSLGVKVPKGAQADIRAVDRATGSVAAAKPVGRAGRFSLSLKPGTYLVVGTVVTKRGKLVQKRIGVSLKSGQKRKRTSLKARKRKRKGRRPRPAFVQERGNVTPGRIAVEIPDVTGSTGDPDWDVFRRGINDLLMHDVFQARSDCGTTLIEHDRRAELIRELEFQQSPYVDPSTRLTRNLIIADIELRGTISRAAGANAKVAMTIVDKHTGRSLGSRETTLDPGRWPDQVETLGKRIADDLCKLSDVYEVTLDVAGEGRFATHSTTGAMHATLRARRDGPGRKLWQAAGPLQWNGVTLASNIPECPMTDPVVPAINWSVTITDGGNGQLQVTWTRDGNDSVTASVDCQGDPDPPPIPGQPGVALLNTGPGSFLVPYAGGTQALSGNIASGTDGFFNTGSITVRPAGVG